MVGGNSKGGKYGGGHLNWEREVEGRLLQKLDAPLGMKAVCWEVYQLVHCSWPADFAPLNEEPAW